MEIKIKTLKGSEFAFNIDNFTVYIPKLEQTGKFTKALHLLPHEQKEFGDNYSCDVYKVNSKCTMFDKIACIIIDKENADIINKIFADHEEKHLPGLKELQIAYNDETQYLEDFNKMMENEDNDGVNPPRRPKANIDDLSAKYPRAAMYLEAEAYENASHYVKSSAGKLAKELLYNGGNLEEAKKLLDNWLNDTFID